MRYLFVIMSLMLSGSCFAQAKQVTDVNRDIDVAVVYEQVVREGYGTPAVYLKLANAYYFKNQYEDAKKWFETLFEEVEPTDKLVLFRYTQTLKALGLDLTNNPHLIKNGS